MLLYGSLSLILVSSIFIYLYRHNELQSKKICFEYSCIEYFLGQFVILPPLINYLMTFAVGLSTIFAALIALNTYITTAKTNTINTHLSHLNTFREFMNSELQKYSTVNPKSINTFKLYKVIFPLSASGNLCVSDEYIEYIRSLNDVIEASNEKNSKELFDHRQHQNNIITKLEEIGIQIKRSTRNDFTEKEDDILDFLGKINHEFCGLASDGEIKQRKYN